MATADGELKTILYALLGVVVVVALAVGVVFARQRAMQGLVKRGARPQEAWGEAVTVANPMAPAAVMDGSYGAALARNGLGHGRTRSDAAVGEW